MESLVTTLETSKALKAAGFPQTTLLHYASPSSKGWILIWKQDGEWDFAPGQPDAEFVNRQIVQSIAAPTAQELADQLPRRVEHALPNSLVLSQQKPGWFASYDCMDNESVEAAYGDTMAEALAALYLALHPTQQSNNKEDGK